MDCTAASTSAAAGCARGCAVVTCHSVAPEHGNARAWRMQPSVTHRRCAAAVQPWLPSLHTGSAGKNATVSACVVTAVVQVCGVQGGLLSTNTPEGTPSICVRPRRVHK